MEFLEAVIDESFMPVKATAIDLLERMPENEFEDMFIELAELLAARENESLHENRKTVAEFEDAISANEYSRNMLSQFGNEEEDD
jgi:hypothetical protein